MMNKQTRMITLLVIIINAAVVAGYVLAQRPIQDNCDPYVGPDQKITTHEWARDHAIEFLKIDVIEPWVDTDITPQDTIGTSVYLFESGSLSVRVSHCLNPTADYFVDVDYQGQTWSMRVSQSGECIITQ